MNPPAVSIGLPVYNGERFLEESIKSLLAQTYPHFELIISDNASTDRTEEICRAYAKSDMRVRYHRNSRNLGLARNFNQAFLLSAGKYFKWAAADDVCQPLFLERCLAILDTNASAVLAYPRARFIDEHGANLEHEDPGWNLQSDSAYERLRYVILAGHLVNSTHGLIRADALRSTRLLPNYPGSDYALLGELSLLGKFVEIADPLLCRRFHPGSSSQNTRNAGWLLEYHRPGSTYPCFPFWNLMLDHCRTIIRSGISRRQKSDLLSYLARRIYWNLPLAVEEVYGGIKAVFTWTRPGSLR